MNRRYEIYQNDAGERLAVPCGFSVLAALLDWIWAFGLRLWVEGVILFVLNGLLAAALYAAKAAGRRQTCLATDPFAPDPLAPDPLASDPVITGPTTSFD